MLYNLISTKDTIKEYAQNLIVKQMEKYKKYTHEPKEADILMLSICDITEIAQIEKLRKEYPEKKILIGGMISEVPILNELSDYVYHGEIYEFAKYTGKIEENIYITTKTKKTLNINQNIEWSENPIVKVGGKACYYYTAKGCPIKCKYCYMSYTREYNVVPEKYYRAAEKAIKKPNRLMPIAGYNPYESESTRGITETLVREYLKENYKQNSKTIRTAIEFVDEKQSIYLAKGIKKEDFSKLIDVSKKRNNKLILYFIAGTTTQEQMNDFFKDIPQDYNTTPNITIVFTYIDPQPFTPFYNFDISQKIQIDLKETYRIANTYNKRLRFMPLGNIANSTIRTLLQRCVNIEQYQYIKTLKKESHNDIILKIKKIYPELIGNDTINDVCNKKREKTSTIIKYYDNI